MCFFVRFGLFEYQLIRFLLAFLGVISGLAAATPSTTTNGEFEEVPFSLKISRYRTEQAKSVSRLERSHSDVQSRNFLKQFDLFIVGLEAVPGLGAEEAILAIGGFTDFATTVGGINFS